MKKTPILTILLASLFFAACSEKKDTASTDDSTKTQPPGASDKTAPSAPTKLSYDPVTKTISWVESKDETTQSPQMKYYVFLFPLGEKPETFDKKSANQSVVGKTSAVIDVSKVDAEKIGAVIVAVDAAGNATASKEILEIVAPDKGDKQAPTAPNNLTYENNMCLLYWEASNDNVTKPENIVYRVYGSSNGKNPETTGKPMAEGKKMTLLSISCKEVKPAIIVIVVAVDEAGNTAASSPLTIPAVTSAKKGSNDEDRPIEKINIQLTANITAESANNPNWKITFQKEADKSSIFVLPQNSKLPEVTVQFNTGEEPEPFKTLGKFTSESTPSNLMSIKNSKEKMEYSLPTTGVTYTLIDFIPMAKIVSDDPNLAALQGKMIEFVRPVHAFDDIKKTGDFMDPLELTKTKNTFYVGRKLTSAPASNIITPDQMECSMIFGPYGSVIPIFQEDSYTYTSDMIFDTSIKSIDLNKDTQTTGVSAKCTGEVEVNSKVNDKAVVIHITTILNTQVIKSINRQ